MLGIPGAGSVVGVGTLGGVGRLGGVGALGPVGGAGTSEPVGGCGDVCASAGELAATLTTASAHQRKDVFMFPPPSCKATMRRSASDLTVSHA
jgi:hypothetical protein